MSTVTSLSEWQQLMSGLFVPVVASPVADGPFAAELRAHRMETVRLIRMIAMPHRLRRRATSVDASGQGFYVLAVPLQGSVVASQDGRREALTPGAWSILDTTRPYEVLFQERTELLMVMFPHRPLELPARVVQGLTATRMCSDDGLAAVVLPLLVRLEEGLGSFHPRLPARLAGSVWNLLATLMLEQSRTSTPAGSPSPLLLAIWRFIDAHLADPDLSADEIAAAHHISPRYLRKIFESQGTTVSGWIRQRRLEHCREELTDPTLSHLPVSSVAARRGLLHAPHFSRLFKEAYGQSPRDYRRTHLSSPADRTRPQDKERAS